MLNAARLQVLKCKESHIKNVLEETRQQLGTITQKPDQYTVLLEKLLLQGLLQLIEDVSRASDHKREYPKTPPTSLYSIHKRSRLGEDSVDDILINS